MPSLRRAWRGFWKEEAKESAVGPIIARGRVGRPVPPMERFDQFAKEAYTKNVVAYRCVEEISKAVASVPLLLFAGEEEAKSDHPLLQFLKRPNPMQGWNQFVSHSVGYYLIAGNTYLEAVAPVGGVPKEMYALRPDRIEVVPGATGFPQAYIYRVGTDRQTFEVDAVSGMSDVRHIKTFHPLDDWYGMSPIQSAATGINQFNAAGEWNQNLLLRGASRRGGLELQKEEGGGWRILDDISYEKLHKRLEEQYSGPRNAGRPFFFEGGLKWIDMDFSPQDMDFINSKHTSARDICSCFGFPPMLLGIPGDNTYSNYKEARQALFENTVMPIAYLYLSELNAWLVPRFAEGLELRADEDQVLALAPRRESLWDRVSAAEFLTLNEKRIAVGYESWEPTGDPADDLFQAAGVLPLGFEPETAEVPAAAAKALEYELKALNIPEGMIRELSKRLFGNGEWRDSA